MHIRRNLAEGRGSRRTPTEATIRIRGADVAIFLVKIRLAGPGRPPPFRSRKASNGISILFKIRLRHFCHRPAAYAVATSNTAKLPTGQYPEKNATREVGGVGGGGGWLGRMGFGGGGGRAGIRLPGQKGRWRRGGPLSKPGVEREGLWRAWM